LGLTLAYGFSLENGNQLWGPVQLTGNAWSYIMRAAEIAYGKVYIWDFGGYVTALDLQTGKIVWTFTPRSAGYDSPYGVYPLWHFGTHSIADGKLFLSESHMYDPPLFKNAQRLAINTTTGELVWSVLSFSGRSPGAIADGYMVQWNSYDNQIYAFGKGPTATSILIQNDIVAQGNSVLVKGMITDESSGTKESDKIARFPNGVPVVSDASMSPWMEYLYMQQIKPTNTTGVSVKLTAIDPNGNTQDVGTATTDAKGNYVVAWTPPVPGLYKITASFGGSESYFGSEEETAFMVTEAVAAPATSPTPIVAPTVTVAPTVAPTATALPSPVPNTSSGISTEVFVAVAGFVVIVAVAAAALFLRKSR
jgi:hypothetical protein